MNFEQLFSFDNLFSAWQKFRRGKAGRSAIISFERHLEDNLFFLSEEILTGWWKHGSYRRFSVFDPKKRDIYTAQIKDRIVHQILYDFLEKIYEPIFIKDSFSSRKGKGVEAAVARARFFLEDEAKWNYGRCFALKCDIRKYFDSVNQQILLGIVHSRVTDEKFFGVIEKVVRSFREEFGYGIPLGNITSQIFANIYLNELDFFVKKEIKFPKYIRYNDDFLFVSSNSKFLLKTAKMVSDFVNEQLGLQIPPGKISIRKFSWGVHFLGRIILPSAVLVRKRTVTRAFRLVSDKNLASYMGLLKNTDSFVLRRKILVTDDFMIN